MRTSEELKREEITDLFTQFIEKDRIRLFPTYINHSECQEGVSKTEFSFEESSNSSEVVVINLSSTGTGFVDCIFNSCMKHYEDRYHSLKKMSLVDLYVKPIFSMSHTLDKTDASTDVIIKMSLLGGREAEFKSRSKSIVYSGMTCILSAFQFYINCEKAFKRIKFLIEDARTRGRGDLLEKYTYSISKLTTVNSYEQKG